MLEQNGSDLARDKWLPHASGADDDERLRLAFARLTPGERQLLVCALAGNYPDMPAPLRMPILRALVWVYRYMGDQVDGVS